KEQRLVIVGTQKMAVFDDIEKDRKLVIYSHSIDWLNRLPIAHKGEGQAVALPAEEPLRKECEHFIESIVARTSPRTDGRDGLKVLEVLDACERSLRGGSVSVQVHETATRYFVDPRAVIDSDTEIGPGTKIWHFSHVMKGSRIGSHCNLG